MCSIIVLVICCLQSHKMLMDHMLMLHIKSTRISSLCSANAVLVQGLADKHKITCTLDAITAVVTYHTGCSVLSSTLTEQVKLCLVHYWRQGNKVGWIVSM